MDVSIWNKSDSEVPQFLTISVKTVYHYVSMLISSRYGKIWVFNHDKKRIILNPDVKIVYSTDKLSLIIILLRG